MFGFKKNEENNKKENNISWKTVNVRIRDTFGDENVDEVLKVYAPELSGAILQSKKDIYTVAENQVGINKNINAKHNELLAELKALREQNMESERRNKELQEKYNALVERMAGYIEKENGRGR